MRAPLLIAGLLAAAALALAGCGGKFSLPTETPGGDIPEKGSYAYTGSVRGLPHLTDVLLTRGTGSTVYVVYDSTACARSRASSAATARRRPCPMRSRARSSRSASRRGRTACSCSTPATRRSP
jgi:hypothetical protein